MLTKIKNKINAQTLSLFIYASSLVLAGTANAQVREWSDAPGCIVDGVPTLKCLEVVYGNLLFMSSILIMVILFIMFTIGSFTYLTSFGDAEKMKKAQGTFKWAVIGIVLYVSAFLILKIIDMLFLGNQGNIFKFEIPSN